MAMPLSHPLCPRLARQAGGNLLHGDASIHRTHQPAEIAAYTFDFVHARDALGRSLAVACLNRVQFGDGRHSDLAAVAAVHVDALMGAVPTGDIAEIAADAFVRMNARDDL